MFSPDGQTLASASEDGTVRLWNLNEVKEPNRITSYACGWLQDYFKHSARAEKGDRHLCDQTRILVCGISAYRVYRHIHNVFRERKLSYTSRYILRLALVLNPQMCIIRYKER